MTTRRTKKARPRDDAAGLVSTIADEIERYLRNRRRRHDWQCLPRGIMERGRRQIADLCGALVEEVRRLAKGLARAGVPERRPRVHARQRSSRWCSGVSNAEQDVVKAGTTRSASVPLPDVKQARLRMQSRRGPRKRPLHRLLVDPQRRPDRPHAHPKPPHPARLAANSLELEGIMREHHKFHVDLGGGSNWLQSRPPFPSPRHHDGSRICSFSLDQLSVIPAHRPSLLVPADPLVSRHTHATPKRVARAVSAAG